MNKKSTIVATAVIAAGIGFFAGQMGDKPEVAVTPPSAEHPPVGRPSAPVGHQNGGGVLQDNLPATDSLGHSSRFTHFSVGDRNVKAILPDNDTMWVGTSGGVIRYNTLTDKYLRYDVSTGLLANGVFHLSKLGDRLLVGTYGGGMSLLKKDGSGWDTYNIPEGLADAFVYDALTLDNGDIWIATWSGANRVVAGQLDDFQSWETYTVKNTNGGLPNDWVYALEKGKNGEIWMATEGGLTRYIDGKWDNWQHEDGLGAPYEMVKSQIRFTNDPAKFSKHHARQKEEMGLQDVDIAYNPNYIIALTVDQAGVVWCGTWGGGLARYDGREWKNYTMADGLPANHIFMLHEDSQGTLWVGTSAGLARMDKKGDFKLFNKTDGLFASSVFSMAVDKQSRYWVGSYGGVAMIDELN